jgi:hypothetical protein
VTITLAIHPRHGQQVTVVQTHGHGALRVETQEGEHIIVAAAWTDWRPRARLPEVDGRMVLLMPEATKELAAYVAARRDASR